GGRDPKQLAVGDKVPEIFVKYKRFPRVIAAASH
ncbi:hypothetical protein L195_g047289, partial [Trifolium pratense]